MSLRPEDYPGYHFLYDDVNKGSKAYSYPTYLLSENELLDPNNYYMIWLGARNYKLQYSRRFLEGKELSREAWLDVINDALRDHYVRRDGSVIDCDGNHYQLPDSVDEVFDSTLHWMSTYLRADKCGLEPLKKSRFVNRLKILQLALTVRYLEGFPRQAKLLLSEDRLLQPDNLFSLWFAAKNLQLYYTRKVSGSCSLQKLWSEIIKRYLFSEQTERSFVQSFTAKHIEAVSDPLLRWMVTYLKTDKTNLEPAYKKEILSQLKLLYLVVRAEYQKYFIK